jgi:hypothetical protein
MGCTQHLAIFIIPCCLKHCLRTLRMPYLQGSAQGTFECGELALTHRECIQGNKIMTPPLDGTILPGVTRGSVLQIATSLGFEAAEEPVTIEEALEADEVFTTGASGRAASLPLSCPVHWSRVSQGLYSSCQRTLSCTLCLHSGMQDILACLRFGCACDGPASFSVGPRPWARILQCGSPSAAFGMVSAEHPAASPQSLPTS